MQVEFPLHSRGGVGSWCGGWSWPHALPDVIWNKQIKPKRILWTCSSAFLMENGHGRGTEKSEVNERSSGIFLVCLACCCCCCCCWLLECVKVFWAMDSNSSWFWFWNSDFFAKRWEERGRHSSLDNRNTYKCWLARLAAAPPAPLNLCCSFWYLMGDWMALRKSLCDCRICLMVSTHSLVASGFGA